MDWLKKLLSPVQEVYRPTHLSDSYWVFSTAHDQEISSKDLMARARNKADGSAARAAYTAMEAALAAERSALQVATSQIAEEIFRATCSQDLPAITCLVDHSGSLRQNDNKQLAVSSAEAVAQMAFKLRVPFEVLGFTTRYWRGEPLREVWLGRGKPDSPGRLCALRHIVYSDFTQKNVPSMKAMFLPNILKENVDGEALLWAIERGRASDRDRHLLVVISDGAPVDDSTLDSNDELFLMNHLKDVVSAIERDETTELLGFGIDYSVSRVYKKETEIRFFGDIEKKALPLVRDTLLA